MTSQQENAIGTMGWADLTVGDAGKVKEFYAAVVGWKTTEVAMGDYSDFCMVSPAGDAVAGICHARGENAKLPPQWLIYWYVEDLDRSLTECAERGGKVIMQPKSYGGQGRYCVIQDPSGAAVALFQKAE